VQKFSVTTLIMGEQNQMAMLLTKLWHVGVMLHHVTLEQELHTM
jgi:hypothetical protein